MPLNFDLAGKTYDPIEVAVTSEAIASYAEASSDPNPRYRPGPDQIASPIFAVVPGFPELARVNRDPELGIDDPLMIMHGEQEFRYHRPIHAGDKLLLTPSIERVEDKGEGAVFVTKMAATTPDGDPVVDSWATIFVRGGGSGRERSPSPKPSAPARGRPVGTFTSRVDATMPARYAAASGDHNPIHLDDEVARSVGLPGVINHGLGTLSLVTGGLVDLLVDGDPARLAHLKVRFTDMVFPGRDLTTTVWESDRGNHFLFETSRPDGAAVMSGGVEAAGA